MATDIDVLKDSEERYEQGNMKAMEFRAEARKDVEFFLNKQISDEEEAYLRSQGRECLVNNKIRRAIMLISGDQRMNQLSSVVIPQGDENQETADIISEAVQQVYTKKDGYHHLSDCFLYGSLVSGINFSEIYLDYSMDPNVPEINFDRIPYNAVIWDPYFTKIDMSDCSYFQRRKLCSKNAVMSMMPQYANEIKKMKTFGGDGKFTDMTASTNPTGQEILAYTEDWVRDVEKRLVILDSETDEFIGIVDKKAEKMAEELVAFDRKRKLVRRQVPTVKLNIIINGELIETASDPLGINEYPFVPFMGIYMPEHDDFSNRLQSVLRVSRDPQSELNRRINKFLDILDSKTHVGYIYKKKALAEGEDIYRAGNFHNIAVKGDAVIGQDIQQITPQPTDPSLIQALSMFDQNIPDTLGLNDASFGIPDSGNDSGLLTMLRQQASVAGLQPIFDNFRQSQYVHTRKVIKAMQMHWPDWKWERVTGKKVDISIRDSSFMKFDASVTLGVLTENQQKLFYSQLVELKRMGVNIYDSLMIKYAPLQNKGSLMKDIQEIEQQQSEQQQKQEALMQQQIELANAKTVSEIKENEAQLNRANSRSIADISLSRAHESEAIQKRSNAALDSIKTAIEIQNAQEDRFIESLNFVESITDKHKNEVDIGMLTAKNIVDETTARVQATIPLEQSQEPL